MKVRFEKDGDGPRRARWSWTVTDALELTLEQKAKAKPPAAPPPRSVVRAGERGGLLSFGPHGPAGRPRFGDSGVVFPAIICAAVALAYYGYATRWRRRCAAMRR